MDEVFWANVVKRWSEASDNVIKLKEELARVKSERFVYPNTTYASQRPQRNSLSQIPARELTRDAFVNLLPDNRRKEATDELLDAEVGLSRAKEEYRRLQQELAASAERIKVLNLENEALSENQRELTKIRTECNQLRFMQNDLNALRSDNKRYLEKIRDLERQQQLSLGPSIPTPVVISLEQQIETLKQSLEAREADNQKMLSDLKATQEKLQKSEETKEVLLSSIVKLQDIARHSTLATLHPISNAILRPQSANLSLSSACFSKIDEFSDSLSKRKPEEGNIENSIVRLPIQNDDITFVERMASKSSFHRVVLSSIRQQAIAAFPPVVFSVEDRHLDIAFDREFLKIALGKCLTDRLNPQSSGKQQKIIASSYLCPTLNHHPWCPSKPGDHGFIFVGLGKDKDSYHTTAIRNLFVGLPKTVMNNRRFRYLGKYRVTRVDPLGVDEWGMLSAEFKSMYTKLTKDRTKDTRTLEGILTAYENGDLRVPCVQLQCIGFDDNFFTTLLAQRDADSMVL